MAGGYLRTPFAVEPYVAAAYKSVAAEYQLAIRVPHYQLAARHLHSVVAVDVALLAGATSGTSEGYFAQSSHLAHHVGGVMGIHYIQVVSTFVCRPEEALCCKFGFEQGCIDRIYDRLIHSLF